MIENKKTDLESLISNHNFEPNDKTSISDALNSLSIINEEQLKAFQDTKDDDKQYKKKRRDIIYNLNTKGRTPRDDTLTKYNIIYDVDKKIFN